MLQWLVRRLFKLQCLFQKKPSNNWKINKHCLSNPFMPAPRSTWRVSSGLFKLFEITLEWSINSQNIWRRFIGRALMNNSPSNIFWILLLLEKYQQNCKVILAATSMKGLKSKISISEFVENKPVNTLKIIQKLSSGSMILLRVTFDIRMILQNIWRRVVGNVMINILPPNIYQFNLARKISSKLSGWFWPVWALMG